MGFEGFLISDYAALDEMPGDYKRQIATSINAGMDMVMIPERYQLFTKLLRELAQEGTVPMSRIDDAVMRILRVKFAMGLMDPSRSPLADRGLQKSFGSAEHRAVARQCVRESLVLIKNDNGALPLKKNAARIHFAGKNANDIGNQCGGWTIFWQGKSGDVIQGTTILEAARAAIAAGTADHILARRQRGRGRFRRRGRDWGTALCGNDGRSDELAPRAGGHRRREPSESGGHSGRSGARIGASDDAGRDSSASRRDCCGVAAGD